MSDTPIRIFIADDHALFRGGLVALLQTEPDIEVVGECENAGELLSALRETPADVLILDISMPGPPVAACIDEIRSRFPDVRVIVLTMHEEAFYLREAIAAGARGFVLKRSSGAELVHAIRAVASGSHFVDPRLSDVVVNEWAEGVGDPPRRNLLSKREEEVLRHLALGNTNREIAEQLNISQRTVETHRANIMKKIGARSRADLVAYALQRGIVSPTQP